MRSVKSTLEVRVSVFLGVGWDDDLLEDSAEKVRRPSEESPCQVVPFEFEVDVRTKEAVIWVTPRLMMGFSRVSPGLRAAVWGRNWSSQSWIAF